jgi:hypothetical protein
MLHRLSSQECNLGHVEKELADKYDDEGSKEYSNSFGKAQWENKYRFNRCFVETTVASLAFRATQATAVAGLSSCVILSRKSDFKLNMSWALNAQHSLSFFYFSLLSRSGGFPWSDVATRSFIMPVLRPTDWLTDSVGWLKAFVSRLEWRAPFVHVGWLKAFVSRLKAFVSRLEWCAPIAHALAHDFRPVVRAPIFFIIQHAFDLSFTFFQTFSSYGASVRWPTMGGFLLAGYVERLATLERQRKRGMWYSCCWYLPLESSWWNTHTVKDTERNMTEELWGGTSSINVRNWSR